MKSVDERWAALFQSQDFRDAPPTIWVAGRQLEVEGTWEVVGVFTTEDKACDACYDEDCFVGPLVLDKVAPRLVQHWPGAYYPLHK